MFLLTLFILLSGCSNNKKNPDIPDWKTENNDTSDFQTNPIESEIESEWEESQETQTSVDSTEEESTEESQIETDVVIQDTPKRITFVGAGDNIIYYGNVRDAAFQGKNSQKEYDFMPSYTDIADIVKKADIAFINQETLMCGEGYAFSYYPYFNGPQEVGKTLVELGFDIVNIANNHMLDKGANGLLATIDFWNSQDTVMIGGYYNYEDYQNFKIYEEQGIKIALLTYTYGTNGLVLPTGSELYIPYIDYTEIQKQVEAAHQQCDMVMVSMHWGDEYSQKANNDQMRLAQYMADWGVDAIIGHHPHVLQPIEWLEGVNGNKCLCVYSLGNIMAEMEYDINMVGGLITFDIVSSFENGISIENVVFIPTVFDFTTSFYNNHIYLMENYTEEMALSHGIRSYGNSTTLSKLKSYVTNVIDASFLPAFMLEN